MKICPKCKGTKFYANAHVVQKWMIDSDGEYLYTQDECVTVAHFPDDNDIWTCANCGYSDVS